VLPFSPPSPLYLWRFGVTETGDSPLAGRDHSLCWSIADTDPQDPVFPIRPLADRCVFNLLWTSFPHVPRSPGRMGNGVRWPGNLVFSIWAVKNYEEVSPVSTLKTHQSLRPVKLGEPYPIRV